MFKEIFHINWKNYSKSWKNLSQEERAAQVIQLINEIEDNIDEILADEDRMKEFVESVGA